MNNFLQDAQKKIKENISYLIEKGDLQKANALIEEYESIITYDAAIYSMRGIIAMMEGDMDEAEKRLNEGLSIEKGNFDLLYNLAYLYHFNDQFELSIKYYKKALQNAKNEVDADEVYDILKSLGVEESKEEIIENTISDNYYDIAIELDKKGNKSDAAINYGLAYRFSKNQRYKNNLIGLYNDNKALKNIFDVAANSRKKRFIILSSCGWGDIYQRMHHIARSLVKLGNEVYYITPAALANINSSNISISDLTKCSYENLKIVDGVKIYAPIQAVFNEQQIANNYIDLVQNLLDSSTDATQTVIITYMPYQVEVINSLNGNFMHIYECVDDHSDLDYAFWGNKKDVVWEQELMNKADSITTTATSLFLQRRAIENRENVFLSRNAVNESDFIFNTCEDVPEDLKSIPAPRIAYVGAIYEWFDTDLFYDVVKSNPDKSFVIIGFGKDEILKEKCSNVYILGPKKHSKLKNYLNHIDIGIIPFKSDTDIIINCDPIKHYEYIACRLPVITTFMPEAAIDKINTFLANTKESFNEAIKSCLELKVDNHAISMFLSENSWNARAALLCKLADKDIGKEEQARTLSYIGKTLDSINDNYDSPIFKMLKAVYLSLDDSKKYEELAKAAYEVGKQKYIEKQYLTSLLINNNNKEFIEIVLKSYYIKEELKKEIVWHRERKGLNNINIIFYISIGDIRKAFNLIDKLPDKDHRLIYYAYLKQMIGEKFSIKELNQVSKNSKEIPLYIFLETEAIKKYKNITILIPTKDRPELLERCISYFNNIKSDELEIYIFILDASNSANLNKTKNFLHKYDISIKHFIFDENTFFAERFIKVAKKIKTDFCCLCADDDFLHKDGIIKSIEILRENREIATVKGKSYIFLNNDTEKTYLFTRDSCVPLTQEKPLERLNIFVKSWVPQMEYTVFRKNDLIERYKICFKIIKRSNLVDLVFLEYLNYFFVVLSGKVVNIEEPLNIRDENPYSLGNNHGFYDVLVNGNFNESYQVFKEELILYCKDKHIDILPENVDYIFKSFLTNSWGVQDKYIKITDSGFDLEKLKIGFEYVNSKKMSRYLQHSMERS